MTPVTDGLVGTPEQIVSRYTEALLRADLVVFAYGDGTFRTLKDRIEEPRVYNATELLERLQRSLASRVLWLTKEQA